MDTSYIEVIVGRRKRHEKPLPRTLRHLGAPERKEILVRGRTWPVPPGRIGLDRLFWRADPPAPGNISAFARALGLATNRDVQIFCDTNIFIAPTDDRLWDQILCRPERLVIVPPVYEELLWWIRDPKCNLRAHKAVQERVDGDQRSTVRIYDPHRYGHSKAATEYYVNLIGMRKRVYPLMLPKLRHELGREPTRQEFSNACKDTFGMRTQLIAVSGLEARVPDNRYNDEALVVMAVFDAIHSGRETVILSSDEDVLEEFYKTVWLVDTHYRAMLFADRYHSNPLGEWRIQRDSQNLRDAFEGEVLLLRKPSRLLRELLPLSWTPVPVHCWLLKGEQIAAVTFMAEREMGRVFEVKARTGGLNTDLLEGRNCHIYLGGLIKTVGDYAAIGRERAMQLPGLPYRFSHVDINLCLFPGEEQTRFTPVDPRIELPPYIWRREY
jgi:hypothetical protein